MTDNDETHYIECSCFTEGLQVIIAHDENLVYTGMFYIGNPGNMSWKDRLRYCWEVIRYGKPFSDQLVLNSTAVAKLKAILEKVTF